MTGFILLWIFLMIYASVETYRFLDQRKNRFFYKNKYHFVQDEKTGKWKVMSYLGIYFFVEMFSPLRDQKTKEILWFETKEDAMNSLLEYVESFIDPMHSYKFGIIENEDGTYSAKRLN